MDDERIRKMLASPLCLQEREASADLPQVYHSGEENLTLSSQLISADTRRPAALFSLKRKAKQELHADRTRILLEEQKNQLFSEASWPGRIGSPRHILNRRTCKGPEPACVQTPCLGVARAEGEGLINVLLWYRLVDVVSASSETHKEGRTGLPARVSGRHVVRG